MQAKEAFDALATMAGEELQKVQQAGADHFASGDTELVHQAADRLQEIKDLMEQLDGWQSRWLDVFPEPVRRATGQRTLRGQRTHQKQFSVPILQALVELGGRCEAPRVVDRVGEIIADILNDHDYELLDNGRYIRWRNTAQWERWDLIQAGYLRHDSPRGIWEITSKGREYLEKNRR